MIKIGDRIFQKGTNLPFRVINKLTQDKLLIVPDFQTVCIDKKELLTFDKKEPKKEPKNELHN